MIPRHNKQKKILIFSGAGISAESGISTFRDSNGLWEKHKIEDVCSQKSWQKNFQLVHDFYNQRREQLTKVKPNQAHIMIAKIKEKYGDDCYVVTQNVDDLFERAGCSDVVHVHGELTKMECMTCGNIWDIGYKKFDTKLDKCPKCGSLKGAKPYIVFFGGQAPMYISMYRAFEVCQHKDSVIAVIGTMGNVVPIEQFVENQPCLKILNNLEQSPYIKDNLFDIVYYEKATTAADKIQRDIEQYFK